MYNRITLLGNAQDAGRPQFACTESCCEDARLNPELSRDEMTEEQIVAV